MLHCSDVSSVYSNDLQGSQMIIEELELKIAKILRIGILISGILMLTGWIINSVDSGTSLIIFKDYDQLDFGYQLLIAYRNKQWGILISFVGLAILVLLPLLRVFLTAILFFVQKETRMGFIASFVFLALITSFFLGIKL